MGFKEIGGYLELERFHGNHFHRNAIPLNSGRGCLGYLIQLRDINTIWVPNYMCESVFEYLQNHDIQIRTYEIGEDFLPDYENLAIGQDEWLLLVDYYGQLQNKDISYATIVSRHRLIVDETQGFFRSPWKGADTIYTCRKWFGVADGGYLATYDGLSISETIPSDESWDRMTFVLGRFERPASEFYSASSDNNELFSNEPPKTMSPITDNILRAVDYDLVKSVRLKNWIALHHRLAHVNKLVLRQPDGPFMYPLMIEEAQRVRAELIKKKIYIPCLWPNVVNDMPADSQAYLFASQILPLPLDQRYGIDEMEYICSIILELL